MILAKLVGTVPSALSERLHDSTQEHFNTDEDHKGSQEAVIHSNAIPNLSKPKNSNFISKEETPNNNSPNFTSKNEHTKKNIQKKEPLKETYYSNKAFQSKNSTTKTTEFTHQDGGVIVTKIHGPHQLSLLQQSICLLHQAYNKKVLYDIVVFTTTPVQENDPGLALMRHMIAPAKLTIVLDNDGLENEIKKLSPIRRAKFLSRCNVTSPEEITWDSECDEEGAGTGKLRYNWQAEFRSWHIWRHEALKAYRYMMWMDTDAFCTQEWDRDPMAIAMKNDLAIYFDNYPHGRAGIAQPRVKDVFNTYLCAAHKTSKGPMVSKVGDDCGGSQLWTIHGFHHITNLDFFRQDLVMKWAETMIGDCFLCRRFDDQLAVTVPAMMLVPEKSWDMHKSGHKPYIFHNRRMDGKHKNKVGEFLSYWEKNGESQFPEAWKQCKIVAGS